MPEASACASQPMTHGVLSKLTHKGGAATEQIQLTLGHQSLATTERYLGLELDAPCDHLGLRWRK